MFCFVFIILRQRERESKGRAEKEGERERIPSRFHMEPNEGLDLTKCEIMT